MSLTITSPYLHAGLGRSQESILTTECSLSPVLSDLGCPKLQECELHNTGNACAAKGRNVKGGTNMTAAQSAAHFCKNWPFYIDYRIFISIFLVAKLQRSKF